MENNKDNFRKQIDLIDLQISTLLNERFECVKKIGYLKKQSGLPVTDEKREFEVLENVTKNFQIAEEKEAIKRIYSTIIQECRNLQK